MQVFIGLQPDLVPENDGFLAFRSYFRLFEGLVWSERSI